LKTVKHAEIVENPPLTPFLMDFPGFPPVRRLGSPHCMCRKYIERHF
jgi:hypothetical protein